jgi:hypothetical protein
MTVWFSQWRTESALGQVAERHIKLTVKLQSTYTVLENTEGSRRFATGCFYSDGQCLDIYFLQTKFEANIEIKIFFYKILNFRFIVDSFHQKPLKSPG